MSQATVSAREAGLPSTRKPQKGANKAPLTPTPVITFQTRIPVELRWALERAALREGLSLNKLMQKALREYVAPEPHEDEPAPRRTEPEDNEPARRTEPESYSAARIDPTE